MLSWSVFGFVIGLAWGGLALNEELPKGYPQCSRNDPNLSQCLLDATNSVRDIFVKGNLDYGLPVMSPLFLELIEVRPDQHPTINFVAKLRNVTIKGLENYEFKSFTFDPVTLKWHGEIFLKKVDLDGDANIKGKVLVLQLQGESLFKARLDDFNLIVDIDGELVQRKNKEYYSLKDAKSQVTIGKGHIEFGEFRNNNKDISATVTKVLQEANEEIFKMLEKPIQDFISQFTVNIFNNLAQQIPYDKFLPP